VDLSFNLLTDIPMPLLLLSNLQRLKMQGNMLERFSLLRGAFASLQELDLNGNNLMSLPSEIVRPFLHHRHHLDRLLFRN
jgi:Leucine-rich repeat (LRR) protein